MSDATDTVQVSEVTADIEDLICDLPGSPRTGSMSFEEPWEIRAFALAVAGHKLGSYDWARFQGALIESISEWENTDHSPDNESWSYYTHWVTALERVLDDNGSLDVDVLDSRHADVLATPANRNHHHAVLEPVAIDPARSR